MYSQTTIEQKAEDILDIFAEYLENIGIFDRDKSNKENFGASNYYAMLNEIMEYM